MRFRWVFSTWDSAVPFLLGLGQFALAELIDPARLHLWFYVLAGIAAFSIWIEVITVRAALSEPENFELLWVGGSRPGPLARFGPLALGGAAAGVGGALLQVVRHPLGLAIAFTAIANAATAWIIVLTARNWRLRVQPELSEEAPAPPA
jgi:hypothetical protein